MNFIFIAAIFFVSAFGLRRYLRPKRRPSMRLLVSCEQPQIESSTNVLGLQLLSARYIRLSWRFHDLHRKQMSHSRRRSLRRVYRRLCHIVETMQGLDPTYAARWHLGAHSYNEHWYIKYLCSGRG